MFGKNRNKTSHAMGKMGGGRYQEAADKKSWQRFTQFLAVTLR